MREMRLREACGSDAPYTPFFSTFLTRLLLRYATQLS